MRDLFSSFVFWKTILALLIIHNQSFLFLAKSHFFFKKQKKLNKWFAFLIISHLLSPFLIYFVIQIKEKILFFFPFLIFSYQIFHTERTVNHRSPIKTHTKKVEMPKKKKYHLRSITTTTKTRVLLSVKDIYLGIDMVGFSCRKTKLKLTWF